MATSEQATDLRAVWLGVLLFRHWDKRMLSSTSRAWEHSYTHTWGFPPLITLDRILDVPPNLISPLFTPLVAAHFLDDHPPTPYSPSFQAESLPSPLQSQAHRSLSLSKSKDTPLSKIMPPALRLDLRQTAELALAMLISAQRAADEANDIEDFGEASPPVLVSLSQLLSRRRAINSHTLQFFIGPDKDFIYIPDAAGEFSPF